MILLTQNNAFFILKIVNERKEIKMRNVLEIEESKKLEQARIRADQAKAKLDDEIKKANAKNR